MFLFSVSYRDFPLSEKSGPFFTVFHYSKKESSSPSFFRNSKGKKIYDFPTKSAGGIERVRETSFDEKRGLNIPKPTGWMSNKPPNTV